MAVYEYECKKMKGCVVIVERGVNDPKRDWEETMTCPECGGPLRRIYSASVVIPAHMQARGQAPAQRRVAMPPGRPKRMR